MPASLSRRSPCALCGGRRPRVARDAGDPFCSRWCAEKDAGTWERNEARRKLLAVTSRHHRVLVYVEEEMEA